MLAVKSECEWRSTNVCCRNFIRLRNLTDLNARVHRGAYRTLPSRRTYIPKADGRQRPLAVAALEDKIVQRATTAVLSSIYEEEFLGFSYGFRPKRGQHDCLDVARGRDHRKARELYSRCGRSRSVRVGWSVSSGDRDFNIDPPTPSYAIMRRATALPRREPRARQGIAWRA
jgi:hypothetical protein